MLGPAAHHHQPRRSRRRRDQGRATRGRLRPPDDLADRRGRLADAPARQPRQAQRRARPAHRRAGREAFRDLVRDADAVVEAMRPGGSQRRGLGYDALVAVNPKIVFITISGYGMTGPYRDMPSHGIAYDTWAGIVAPGSTRTVSAYLPEHVSIGINAGPLYGALGILAGMLRARETGVGLPARDRAVRRGRGLRLVRSPRPARPTSAPQSEVTGNAADDYERRAPGTAGMRSGRPLPDLRDHRRPPRAVHGVGAGVLEELLRRRSTGPICSNGGRAPRTATTPAATASCS